MKCETCQDKGFTEEQVGLIMKPCPVCNPQERIDVIKAFAEATTGEINEHSISGARPDNKSAGSRDTSEPTKPKKLKARKTARKGTS